MAATMTASKAYAGRAVASRAAAPAARRPRTLHVVAGKKVLGVDDKWKKGLGTVSFINEVDEDQDFGLLSGLEKKGVLSGLEQAKVLSSLEKSGLTLSKIEKMGLLSTAEDLGLLSLAEKVATTPKDSIAAIAALPILASVPTILLISDAGARNAALALEVATTVLALGLSIVVGFIQED